MKILIVIGLCLGIARIYVFCTMFKEHLDDLVVTTKYQIVNGYVLNNGDYAAIKSQHEAWLYF